MAHKPDTALILKTIEFAAARHRTQFRKGADKTPYINHPVQVANLLANEGGEYDPELLTASILHDVIEDTVDTTEEKEELIRLMRKEFGEEVLSVTLEVTDDKMVEKSERKRLQIVNAPNISINAKKLRLADKIMNIHDMIYNPPVDWSLQRISDYFDWCEKVVAGLGSVNKKLEIMFSEVLKEGRLRYGFRSETSE
jgi:GTP diphosphokinase / guanosine-3',5'-bis(diphosphate) 3'-diphosphatase